MSDEGYFEILGISANARDYEILKIVIDLFEESGTPPTFTEIEDKINSLQEVSFTKQWIYKCLKNLEEQSFITVDRIGRPTTFTADLMDLRNGLSILIKKKMNEFEESKQETQEAIDMFERTNIYDLANYLVDILTGKKIDRVSGVIEGRMNVRQSLIMELCERTRPGDIIRINNRSNLLEFSPDHKSSIEYLILESIVKKGLIVRVLLPKDVMEMFRRSIGLSQFVKDNVDNVMEGIISGQVEIRDPIGSPVPYRMITINNDKMFMFLADTPSPDTVAIIFREGNPVLINQAVRNFDMIWDKAKNLSDYIKEEIEKTDL